MADAARTLVPTIVAVLLVSSVPNAAADHTVSRAFLVGGSAGGAALPLGTMDQERCDFECDFTVGSVRYVFVSVQGPDGRSFPYQWQLNGCSDTQPFRPGHGERLIVVGDCTTVTVRPHAAEVVVAPWGCTYQPLAGNTPVAAGVGVPLSSSPGDFAGIADCAQSCAVVDVPQPCLPFPAGQLGGTVTLRW